MKSPATSGDAQSVTIFELDQLPSTGQPHFAMTWNCESTHAPPPENGGSNVQQSGVNV
jgi:hypothetical protein